MHAFSNPKCINCNVNNVNPKIHFETLSIYTTFYILSTLLTHLSDLQIEPLEFLNQQFCTK